MALLQVLRQSRLIARCVLAWFVMSMAVAMAAPVVQPQGSALVCSAAGAVKLVDTGSEDGSAQVPHTLDCVLCLALDAPGPAASDPGMLAALPAGHGAGLVRAPVVVRSDATLAARAPPAWV